MTAPGDPSGAYQAFNFGPTVGQSDDKYADATCPLPGCDASLYITWRASRAVYLSDRATDLANPQNAHTRSWEVGCSQGHVLLLPPDTAVDSYTFGECDNCENSPEPDARNAAYCSHGDLARLSALVASHDYPLPDLAARAVDNTEGER